MSAETDVRAPLRLDERQTSGWLLATGRVSVDQRPEKPCAAHILGLDAILIRSKAESQIDEPVLCRLDSIGLLSGRISGLTQTGFTIALDICAARRSRIAVRIAWLVERRRAGGDQRATPRIVPHHRAVTIRLPDGRCVQGEIENLSKTGAKISLLDETADLDPPSPSTLVLVGKRYAVVTRTDTNAIAVQFQLPFADETFNRDILL
jgi:hypothetical protein